MTRKARSNGIGLATLLYIFACIYESSVFAASAPASESVDQLYEKAKKEGGQITVDAPLSNRAIEVIPPAFMKRFPGVTVNHIDATPINCWRVYLPRRAAAGCSRMCSAGRYRIWHRS